MSRLKQLQDRKLRIVTAQAEEAVKMRALLDAADKDSRDLTDEETTQYAAHEKVVTGFNEELIDVDAKLVQEERLQQLEREMPAASIHSPDVIDVKEPNVLKDPKKGFRTPRDFITSVLGAGMGRPVDARLGILAAAGSDEQSTFADPYGGYLVPQGFSATLTQLDPETDPIAGRTTMVPMEQPALNISARVDKNHSTSVSGGLTVTRREESASITASRMTLERLKFVAYSLFGLSYVTEELLTDSPTTFAALLAAGFSDEFTSHMIDERLNGTGVGEHLGVLNSACLIPQAKESQQAADTIELKNIQKMRSRCWRYENAIWLANHDTYPQLGDLNQAIGTGGTNVWQPSIIEDRPDMLLGRPIFFTEYCQTLGDKGDIVLGNWSQYLEGVLQPMQSAESMHVRFLNHERTFKFWLRNAGLPWWTSALTPKNSTVTLSPFVTLAARA